MLLNEADKVYFGTTAVDRVYRGATLVWEPAPVGGVSWGPDEVLYGPGSPAPAEPADPNTFMVGTRMTVLVDGRITHIRYYRHSSNPPSRYAAVWSDTGTLLGDVVSSGDAYGWNAFPLATPIIVTAGQIIRAAYGNTGSATFGGFAFYMDAPPMPSGANLQFNHGVYTTPAPSGADRLFPENIIVPNHYFGDVVFQEKLAGEEWVPTDIAGLHVWLDADQLGLADGADVATWPNLGAGADPMIILTPPSNTPMKLKANALNGKPVVRFTTSEGRLRSAADWGGPIYDWTVIYVCRWWGATTGRAFTVQYPPSNLLIGMHTSQNDSMYDNGTWLTGPASSWGGATAHDWRLYEGDSESTGTMMRRFFINGVQIGPAVGGTGGFTNGWGLSGYEGSTAETMDLDVAELLIYDRKLSDAERIQVEDYLRTKWGL